MMDMSERGYKAAYRAMVDGKSLEVLNGQSKEFKRGWALAVSEMVDDEPIESYGDSPMWEMMNG